MQYANAAKPLIDLDKVCLRRDGGRTVLSDVCLRVRSGDFVAITGPNGGGKTTLLRIILRLLKPTSGTVEIAPGLTIGYLPQKNAIDSHFPISVTEVIESGLLAAKGLDKEQRDARVKSILQLIEMENYATHPIGRLSGGQLQRTLFGRAIISKPALLVLDEPLSYLDKKFEQHLYTIIAELAKTATILLVSHEMSAISAMATRHIIIDHTLHECSAAHHFIPTDCE